jgi:secreted trypsin-like serine protease
MRTLTLLLVLAVGAIVASPAGAVSGGKPEPIADVPYVVWLPNGCTGTLIAPDRVLTAGHCLDGYSAGGFSVLVAKDGNALHGSKSPYETAIANGGIPARGFSVHPKFKESFPFAHKSPENAIALDDVGVILLAQPVTGITPVKLPAAGGGTDETVGETGSLFGYGITLPALNSIPKSLRTGDMKVISSATCAKAYPHAIIASEICGEDLAHKRAPWITACPGDSGGPFIHETPAGPVQIGVTSWGAEVKDVKCGRGQLPDVYMRVSSFESFITDPNPVIEPFPPDPFKDYPTVTGVAKVGKTLTCNAPTLGGSPAKLSFQWIFDNKTVSRKSTATATKAMAGRSVGCIVTARNAGGHFVFYTPAVGRLKIAKD